MKKLFVLLITVGALSFLAAQTNADQKEIVVLLHGLGRGKSIMYPLRDHLRKEGFSVALVDYHSIGRSPQDILKDVALQIKSFTSDSAQTVHFVGHSLGGLLIRAYLDSVTVPHLGRIVLIGSPNGGTPFVDRFRETWWLKMVGPVASSLGTDAKSFPKTLRRPYYPVGIIAGNSSVINNEDLIPGDDDGIVPVESTTVEGMTDFFLVPVSHSFLPKDEMVMQQTSEFLKHGRFLHERNIVK